MSIAQIQKVMKELRPVKQSPEERAELSRRMREEKLSPEAREFFRHETIQLASKVLPAMRRRRRQEAYFPVSEGQRPDGSQPRAKRGRSAALGNERSGVPSPKGGCSESFCNWLVCNG